MVNPVLVQVLRGDFVESFHRGALAVVDAAGMLRLGLGDIDRPVFPRSAVKALQALPLVASGAADALQLSAAQLALACASHSGEPEHVATAQSLLQRAGLGPEALECGAHWPYDESASRALARSAQAPTALHNNCSGKHGGFLCLACHLAGGREVAGFARDYRLPTHPVMREVSAALGAATGIDLGRAPMGIDGCGIPTFAIPLRALALGFARLGTGTGLSPDHAAAARRLREAVAAHPSLVAGSGRADTRLAQALGTRLFCKVGAEGVYTAALPELGLGLALKMDDGNTARAAEVVLSSAVQALLPGLGAAAPVLQALATPNLRNWVGTEVGAMRPSPELLAELPPALCPPPRP